MRILILGGTAEARELAGRLVGLGHDVTTSLAGRTRDPALPAGDIRVGKFGGIPGLVGYLTARGIELLVDATHPYAGLISINAVAASERTGIRLVRMMRPPWPEPDGAGWVHVADMAGAAAALPTGSAVLVTTGHEGLETLLLRGDCRLVVRLIEPPDLALPPHARLLLGRPPYSLEGELALMRQDRISHLASKNSGGSHTAAKLDAARQLGVTVIVIARPVYGPATEVETVDAAVEAIAG